MVKRHIKHVSRWLVVTSAVTIFLIAALLSIGRGIMAQLPEYKQELAELIIANSALVDLRFGELQGRWVGFSPRLEGGSVEIVLEGDRRIEVGRVELEFATLRSLWHGRPMFKQVLFDQLLLSVHHTQKHGWDLEGLERVGQPVDEPEEDQGNLLQLVQGLLIHDQFELRNAVVQVQLDDQPPLPPQLINVKMENVGDQLALEAELRVDSDQAVEVRAISDGLPGQKHFDGQFYLRVPELDQRFWYQLGGNRQGWPERFNLGGEFWGQWRADGRHQLQGQLRLPELFWHQQSQQLTVTDLQIDLGMQLEGMQQGQLMLSGMQGLVDGLPIAVDKLALARQQQQWRLSTDRLALEPLWQWLQSSSLVPETLKKRLDGLDPVGQLGHAQFTWSTTDAEPFADFNLVADLNRVGVSAWRGAPALQGVDGRLQLDRSGGRVDFTSSQFGLNFPLLYRQGWQFDQAQGVVSWQLDSDGVVVQSQRLQLEGESIQANGRFSLEIPNQVMAAQQPGRLVLMIGMEQADALLAPRFVPDKLVSPALFGWLEQSIEAGRLKQGGLVLELPLKSRLDEAIAERTGSLQMFFDVDQGLLRYQPEWPALEQSSPFVLYKDGELLIDLPQGQLLDSKMEQGIAYLAPNSSLLQVQGSLNGPAKDIRTTLLEAPIRDLLVGLQPWQLSGNSQSELTLGIDLKQPQHSLIRVESQLQQGQLENSSVGIKIDQIQGGLSYHETQGLNAERLEGVLFGQPVIASISTERSEQGNVTLIEGSGRVAMSELKQWLRQPLLEPLQGESDYQLELKLCPGADCSNLRVHSLLQGVSADIPAPFGKSAAEQRPLSVDVSLETQPWLQLDYDGLLGVQLALGSEQLKAEVVLGKDQPFGQRPDPGVWVTGHVDQAEFNDWLPFIQQRLIAPYQQPAEQNTTAAGASSGAPATEPVLSQVKLRVDQLNAGELRLNDLRLQLEPRQADWLLQVEGPLLQGQLLFTADPQPWQLDLSYLKLPPEEPKPLSEDGQVVLDPFDPDQDPLLDIDPSQLPSIDVSIDQLQQGERQLGHWQFELRPYAKGAKIEQVKVVMDNLKIGAELDWQYQNQLHRSWVDLNFEIGNLGRVMENWGSTPSIETKSAQLNGQLNWLGSPLVFNWQTLGGEVRLAAKDGLILEGDDQAQAVKIFSLFNSRTLVRRLKLDFSDLSTKGISFDKVKGHYRFSDGVATSISPLKVEGPTIDVLAEGKIDFYNETHQQRFEVHLPVTENLPVAAALLATPQIAGAIFLVEKLIGKKLKKFTSIRYQHEGSWSASDIEVVEAPEPTGNKPPFDER